jgi:hypothetical protein
LIFICHFNAMFLERNVVDYAFVLLTHADTDDCAEYTSLDYKLSKQVATGNERGAVL